MDVLNIYSQHTQHVLAGMLFSPASFCCRVVDLMQIPSPESLPSYPNVISRDHADYADESGACIAVDN